jgi:hypothetical protein
MLISDTDIQDVETPIFISNLYSGSIDPATQSSLEDYSNNIISYNFNRQGLGQGQIIFLPTSALWSLMLKNNLSCLTENGCAGIYTTDTRLIGVLQESADEFSPVRILIKGLTDILIEDDSSVTYGDWLIPSTDQVGRVVSAGQTSKPANAIGYSLITSDSGTDKIITAIVDCMGVQ